MSSKDNITDKESIKRKKKKLTEMNYIVDTIANIVQLVKAQIVSNTIIGVVNNENGKIITDNINTVTNWIYQLKVYDRK